MIHYLINDKIKNDPLSYRKLAAKLELSYTTIIKLAHAQTQKDIQISTVIINKLCRHFKCQPNDLKIGCKTKYQQTLSSLLIPPPGR